MEGNDIYKIFITMGFNFGPDDGYSEIDSHTILINQHMGPPLIFSYNSQDDWYLMTCKKYIITFS